MSENLPISVVPPSLCDPVWWTAVLHKSEQGKKIKLVDPFIISWMEKKKNITNLRRRTIWFFSMLVLDSTHWSHHQHITDSESESLIGLYDMSSLSKFRFLISQRTTRAKSCCWQNEPQDLWSRLLEDVTLKLDGNHVWCTAWGSTQSD